MNRDIRCLKGIGDTRAALLEKMNIKTIGDLLYLFPRSYEDRTKVKFIAECIAEETVCVCVTVFSAVRENRIKKNLVIYSMKVMDETGFLNIVWFNNRYIKNAFKKGEEYIMYGKITRGRMGFEMSNPVYEKSGREQYTGKVIPIYPLTNGLTQKNIQAAISQALKNIDNVPECIPDKIRKAYRLAEMNFAIENIHFPKDFESYSIARRRFVFEELFVLQMALSYKKAQRGISPGPVFNISEYRSDFLKSMPFELTKSQLNTLADVDEDFSAGKQMSRLVQGDVGSGKTVIAAYAAYIAAMNGYQAVIMAPTEILAGQHYESLAPMFEKFGIKTVLLTGSLTPKNKRETKTLISENEAKIIIGTNAVMQKDVTYSNLGLVVVDEQHRFGVEQRAKLTSKGSNPHLLVMSATPIPRTLALILYGDLSISVINELPPGRKPVKTYAVGENMRERIERFIEKNVLEGGQCYVVCPLIEETEKSDLNNAVELKTHLSGVFPEFRVGLMHGKMKPAEKDEVMAKFADGNIDILVSTTVVEVGVNVPNSNLMIIENAERFGLSQLHQLRGRVGRGKRQSHCVLFAHGTNEVTKKRMETMCMSNDGFYISEQDLKLRGPGDFFGTRQHGLPEMKIANLFEDSDLLRIAQKSVSEIYKSDPKLENYPVLKARIENIYNDAGVLN